MHPKVADDTFRERVPNEELMVQPAAKQVPVVRREGEASHTPLVATQDIAFVGGGHVAPMGGDANLWRSKGVDAPRAAVGGYIPHADTPVEASGGEELLVARHHDHICNGLLVPLIRGEGSTYTWEGVERRPLAGGGYEGVVWGFEQI